MSLRATLLAAVCALASGCVGNPRALIIGIDGLRPDQLAAAHTPTIDALAARGAIAWDATNAWTADDAWNGHSATNWGVLLTGVSPRTADLTHNGDTEHLVDDDGDEEGLVRTMFGHAKRANPEAQTACFNTWGGIGMEPGTILAAARTSVDMHFSSRSESSSAERDAETVQAALEALTGTGRFSSADVDLMFVHISQVDAAGHAHTYDDPSYRASIEEVDALVGQLLAAIEGRENRKKEDWLVILSTDHGGPSDEYNHADNDDPQVRTIPFVMALDGILPGTLDLNGASLYDITPTVLDWMEVEIPGGRFPGRSRLP